MCVHNDPIKTQTKLLSIKEDLEKNGFVLVEGSIFRALLIHFGALPHDLDRLEAGMVHERVEKDIEPNMYFRQVAFHRMIIEGHEDEIDQGKQQQQADEDSSLNLPGSSNIFAAHCEAVTQIKSEEISNRGATVTYKRSGTRKWNIPPQDYVNCSVPFAFAALNDFLQPEVHEKQEHLNRGSKNTINDQILIRVNKDRGDVGDPTPEGIHQDGNEISTITLLQRVNVRKDVGSESRLWTLEQPTGNYSSEKEVSWKNCLFNKALDSSWETLIFNDRKVKHEVRPFYHDPSCTSGPCHRDVIVNFVRKPLTDGSDKKLVHRAGGESTRVSIS